MRKALENGKQLLLNFADENTNGGIIVEIDETIGTGASCIAYEVSYCENISGQTYKHSGLLKEFFPADYGSCQLHIERGANGELQIPPEKYEQFEIEKNLFLKSYKTLTDLRYANNEMANDISDGQWVLSANNTLYLLFSYDAGDNYEAFQEDSIDDIIKNAISIAEAIAKYHERNYLHLDIKPANILFTDIKRHVIKLFDFGSVVSFEDIKNKPLEEISYSRQWAAPELLSLSVDEICPATDIFAIGTMIFHRIMHRYPERADMKNFAKYSFDKDDSLFENVSPAIFRMLETLFRKTLCVTVQKRYQSCEELIGVLNGILRISNPETPYLMGNANSLWFLNDSFVGREKEIALINEKLDEHHVVVLHGFGGIGKTALAKYYGITKNFDTVYCANYRNSLRELIVNMPFANINDGEWLANKNGENDDTNLYKKKCELISKLDEHTLIIIDNFNVTDDAELNVLLSSKAKIIFTSRYEIARMEQYKISVLPLEFVDAKELYSKCCDGDINDGELESLLTLIGSNTLLIKLIACAISKSHGMLSLSDFVNKMNENSLQDIGVNIQNYDEYDERVINQTVYMHLRTLFNMATISSSQIEILKDLSLLGMDELTVDEYNAIKGIKSFDVINDLNELNDKGWLQNDEEYLYIHPLISELILEDDSTKPTDSQIEQLTILAKNYMCGIELTEWLKLKRILGAIVNCVKKLNTCSDNLFDELTVVSEEALRSGCIDVCRNLINSFLKFYTSDSEEDKVCRAAYYSLLSFCDVLEGKMTSAANYQAQIEETLKTVDMMKYPYDLAMIFYYTANYYRYTTNYKKALEYHEAYVKIKKKYDIVHFDDVDSGIVAGTIYQADGKYLSAIECFKNVEKALGSSKSKNEAFCRLTNNLNLALAYFTLSNHEKALEYCKKVRDDDSFSELSPQGYLLYNHLSIIFVDLNMPDKAQKYSDLEMKIADSIYGKDSIQHYHSLVNRANVLYINKKTSEAIETLDSILNTLEARNQENIEVLSGAYNIKGLIQMKCGELESAATNLKKASSMRKDIYGDKHPNVAISYLNVGFLYAELRRFELAEQNLRQALFVCENSEIVDTVINARIYNCMGTMYYYMKRHSDAIDYYTRALKVKKALWGYYHFETADSFDNMALVYEDVGNLQEAVGLREQIEDVLLKVNGSKDKLMANYVRLSNLLMGCGKEDDALTICEKAKKIGDYPGIELIYNNMGVIYFNRQDYDSAFDSYKEAFTYETDDNENNFGIINANMAVLGLVLGYYDKALEYFDTGIYLYNKYGINDFNTFIAYVRCAECNYWLEKYEDTISMCERAEAMYLDGIVEYNPLVNFTYELFSESYGKLGDRRMSKEYRKKMRS